MKSLLTKKLFLSVVLGVSILTTTNVLSKTTKDKDKNNEVKIEGVVQTLPANFTGNWKVNNKIIEVNKTTKVEGNKNDFKKGVIVEVEAIYINNKFVAQDLEIKGNKEKDDDEENDK